MYFALTKKYSIFRRNVIDLRVFHSEQTVILANYAQI